MAFSYTSVYQVFSDSTLYFITRKGGKLTLGLFPAIARERWAWFVENFNTFSRRFEVGANGNLNLVKSLEDLRKFVEGFKLGNTRINPFDRENNLIKFRPFLDQITLSEVNLTPSEIRVRDEELARTGSLNEEDFRSMLALLRQKTAIAAQELGLGDDTANAILGLNPRRKRRSPRVKDILDIAEINRAYKFIEGFIFDKQRTQKRPPNLLRISQQNLDVGSGFRPQDVYQTYYPVPFEISLESMAKKYLGSVQKWFELATINNLQPPFVDQTGTKFDLIAPAASNNLIISSGLAEAVAPGVRIGIGSFKIREESRIIERVVINDDDTMVLFLSGAADLNKFLPDEGAFVRVYKPNTARPNSLILIPTTSSPSADTSSKPTPSKDEIRRLEKAFIQFGVDVARDEKTGDLIFDSNGNFKLSYGIRAVRQAVRNTLRTNVRELSYHPNYGINYSLGRSYMGTVDEAVKIGDLIRSGILRDQRLEDAKITRISSTKQGASLQMAVKIKGLDDPIPLSFVT